MLMAKPLKQNRLKQTKENPALNTKDGVFLILRSTRPIHPPVR